METELSPNQELHPEIAFQIGVPQERTHHDIHPSLQAELMPQEQPVLVENETEIEDEMVENQSNTEEVAQEVPVETPKDRQWKEVKARAEEAKMLAREKEQLERELAFYRQQQPKQVVAQDEDEYLTDTEKRLKREMQELKSQVAQQAQETKQAQQQAAVYKAQQQLRKDYADIDIVVSEENIERLKYEYPHLYNSVVASSDVYSVGASAYEMIKAKGIYKAPTNALQQITSGNANRNVNKPKSASTVSPQSGQSPIQQASNFMGQSISSEDERKSLWAEMNAASRNRL